MIFSATSNFLSNILAFINLHFLGIKGAGHTSLALFGSVVRGAGRPDSDIDVLVGVDPGARFSLIDLVSVKDFLEDQLGRRVDVVTKEGLEPAVRDRVLGEAEAVF
jgi:hypothetical protein